MKREKVFRKRFRESGIALMVVMVVFIILYLVVFQLHYTTRLEEKLSKARSADAQGSAAIRSVSYYILQLLAEDYQQGNQQNTTQARGTSPMMVGDSRIDRIDTGKKSSTSGSPGGKVVSSAGSAPSRVPAPGAGGGTSKYDYLHKNIFLPNNQTLNRTTVKIVLEDNERKFDLNRIWDYAPSQAETLSEVNEEQEKKADESEDEKKMLELLDLADPSKKSSRALKKSKQMRGSKEGEAGAETEAEEEMMVPEWEPPDALRRQETVAMLGRAIDLMYRYNTEYGLDYRVMPPEPQVLADAIERYAFDRRSQQQQSYIHLTSELLNVLAMLNASPEVYYGPVPDIPPGEEFYDRYQEFRYSKDEFGDLVGEYIYSDEMYAEEREIMQEQLSELKSLYGEFANFPGFGRMGNPMTRNMKEFTEYEDEFGNIFLAVPPMPIGLKDLFCTYSTGKININTAPMPILYALLPLLIETEPDGEERAEEVARNIVLYRNMYQPAYDETDPTSKEMMSGSSGAPYRKVSDAESSESTRDLIAGLTNTGDLAGLSPEELAELSDEGSANYETNYFTNLSQLKLIDGEEGGPEDYLTDQGTAADTSELARKSPLQKVIHDYKKVMVFGSTYFQAILKSKTEDSPSIKTGYLTIYRDLRKRRLEVVQWKELQK